MLLALYTFNRRTKRAFAVAEGIRARIDLSFDGFTLDVDLSLPGRGVTALFGPSGSGKTTLLRCIAGLQSTQRGLISVNGETWQDEQTFVPVHRRPLGYVFQEASLFGHLSVRKNLEYGLQRVPTGDSAKWRCKMLLTCSGSLHCWVARVEVFPEASVSGLRSRVRWL